MKELPAAPVALPPPPSGTPRVWRAGTLTYTGAGLLILFCWLLWGDFAWALKERSVSSAMQIMLKKFGAADWMMGVLVGAVPPAIAMIFFPIISYHSDRHRGRWGRRIPFLLIPAPITAAAMIGLALSPALAIRLSDALGERSPGVNACTLLLFAVFWTMFDFASAAANGLFVALINDVVPTEVLGRFFGAFRIFSLAAGMAFNYWLLGKVESHFAAIFIGIGVVFGLGFSLMCLNIKEGEYPPPPPRDPRGGLGSFLRATSGYLRECFGKPFYLIAFAVMAVPSLVFAPVNLFSIFFAKSIDMNFDTLGKWTAAMYLISTLLSYPLGMLADRFHPLRVGMVVLGLYGMLTLWGGLFIHDAVTFTIGYVGGGVLAGAWMTSTASLALRLLPKAKFAEYNSALGIVHCLAQILIGPALGALLDLSGHVYRYSYLASFFFAILCLFAASALYRRFLAQGGFSRYSAP